VQDAATRVKHAAVEAKDRAANSVSGAYQSAAEHADRVATAVKNGKEAFSTSLHA
jgi:hypothetical protein